MDVAKVRVMMLRDAITDLRIPIVLMGYAWITANVVRMNAQRDSGDVAEL